MQEMIHNKASFNLLLWNEICFDKSCWLWCNQLASTPLLEPSITSGVASRDFLSKNRIDIFSGKFPILFQESLPKMRVSSLPISYDRLTTSASFREPKQQINWYPRTNKELDCLWRKELYINSISAKVYEWFQGINQIGVHPVR